MNALITALAVSFLLEPPADVDARVAQSISEDANAVYAQGDSGKDPSPVEKKRGARITSVRSDFDRKRGVAMFEGNVLVSYGDDCTMAAERLFVFLDGTNKLSRIVALGNVSITNETRIGRCAMAEFRRKAGEIEMFGDGNAEVAHLFERDGGESVTGSRIRFWLDTEQVEVEDPTLSAGQRGGKGVL